MFETKAQAINNCLQIVKCSTPMSRDFGLVAVDNPASSTIRREITLQLATYYPEVMLNALTVSADGSGHFVYNISVVGE